jgi:hypothetical protein
LTKTFSLSNTHLNNIHASSPLKPTNLHFKFSLLSLSLSLSLSFFS